MDPSKDGMTGATQESDTLPWDDSDFARISRDAKKHDAQPNPEPEVQAQISDAGETAAPDEPETEEPTAAGRLLDEEFPRVIKLKGEVPLRDRIVLTEPTAAKEPAAPDAVPPLRQEPFFDPRERDVSGSRDIHALPRPGPVLARRYDEEDGPHGRTPPRFHDESATFPSRIVPEPIGPRAFALTEEPQNDRSSPLRWAAVAAFLVVGCYAAVNTVQPERFFAPPTEIAQSDPPPPQTAPTIPAAVPSKAPARPSPAMTAEESVPAPAQAPKVAEADTPSAGPAAKKPAPRRTVAAAPVKPASPRSATDRNESDEAALEAPAGRQARPVTLAPGPRMLDASPAIPASLPARLNGDLVYDVQAKLMRLGYSPGPVDGVLSPQTRNAIMHFQNDAGLPPTGEIDTELLRRLRTTRQVDLRFGTGPAPVAR